MLDQDALTDLICRKLASADAAAAAEPARTVAPAASFLVPPPPVHRPAPVPAQWPYGPPPYVPPPRTLRVALRRSRNLIGRIALLVPFPGTIFATYTFQLTPHSFPVGRALRYLLLISLVMGTAAWLVSALYDVVSWRQKLDDFAILDWPWWHKLLVGVAAVALPLAVIYVHRVAIEAAAARLPDKETGFLPWDPAWPYGTPPYFWWLSPAAMLGTHALCLTFRYVRRYRRAGRSS